MLNFNYIGGIIASTLIGFLTSSPTLFIILLVVSAIGVVVSLGIGKDYSQITPNKGMSG